MSSSTWVFGIVLLGFGCLRGEENEWAKIMDFPLSHIPFLMMGNSVYADMCRNDPQCPYKLHLDQEVCWGYEDICARDNQYLSPSCPGEDYGWAKNKSDQHNMFFEQGDFGYIRERKRTLFPVCTPREDQQDGSSLECCDHMRFCRGRNIFFNFSSQASRKTPTRYQMDVIASGEVGGFCALDRPALDKQLDHMSALQSWSPELQHFTSLDYDPIATGKCEVIIDDPTFIVKIDATVNMYHHFCDFVNLYATQHLNQTFGTDVRILLWDEVNYRSNFGVAWNAFTRHPVEDLQQYVGKNVCFRDVVFPFLPRMIFGMYYNMPLIRGCHGSGLFHAFAHHFLHRLRVKQDSNQSGKVRVTFLMRSTTYRKILNAHELIDSLKANGQELEVRTVDFNWDVDFMEQLRIVHNTDILIGIHGAGLTHSLFLPDWGAVFEIYNCEDEGCYKDLANLRGVAYYTWEKADKVFPEDEGHHPTMGAHAKFTNYSFDAEEFVRMVFQMVAHVRTHPEWQRRWKEKASPPHGDEL